MSNTVRIESVALWTPALPGWAAARAAFRDDGGDRAPHATPTSTAAIGASPTARPAATLLAANERRRAPDSVLIGLEVAQAAATAAGRPPGALASVFASAHGDLAITDALCRTLAKTPHLLSPTRFHHSVHNAVSGYWAIAAGSHAASTALSAHALSFGAGLLEALCQCAADAVPLLLVAYDTAACGPLLSVNGSRGLLAVALVLAPVPPGDGVDDKGRALTWSLQPGNATTPLRCAAALALADNAMAGALPLCEALAHDGAADVALPVSGGLYLALRVGAACEPQRQDTAASSAAAVVSDTSVSDTHPP